MTQDWKGQLLSDDPKMRAQAVKNLAFSGDQDNLKYLKEIVENDPDPNLREYAKKAAQHLYSSTSQESVVEGEGTTLPSPDPEAPQESIEGSISNADIRTSEQNVQRAFSLHTSGRTLKAIQVFGQALELNPDLNKNSFVKSVASEITSKTPEAALNILNDPVSRQEMIDEIKGKDKKSDQKPSPAAPVQDQMQIPAEKSRSNLIRIWLKFFQMTEEFLQREVKEANNEDTFLSVLVFTITTVALFLITGFFQFQLIAEALGGRLSQFGVDLGMIFFILLLAAVIMTPLTFYFNTGAQYLGVRLFGGSGDFKSHAYLLAMIQVPATILGGFLPLLAFVPIVRYFSGLAGVGLSIYIIILTIRSIKVAHGVSTGRAIGGLIIPPLILTLIGGCIMITAGSALGNIIAQMQ